METSAGGGVVRAPVCPSETSLEGWKRTGLTGRHAGSGPSETSLEGWKPIRDANCEFGILASETSLEGWKRP